MLSGARSDALGLRSTNGFSDLQIQASTVAMHTGLFEGLHLSVRQTVDGGRTRTCTDGEW
jgi:hypothetical protein